MIVIVVVIVAVVCALASHLGLTQAVGKTIDKVFGCTKCFTFWISALYFYISYSVPVALACAIAASYLSIWVEVYLVFLNRKYNELWKRLVQKKG